MPAQVCAPVVTTPLAVALAVGKVALVPELDVTIGPAVVPAVIPKLVGATYIAVPSNALPHLLFVMLLVLWQLQR